MFLLKKIVSGFLLPLPIVLGLFLAGLVMLRSTKGRPAARKLLLSAFMILVLSGYGAFSSWPLTKLETFYPPVDEAMVIRGKVQWIVVLGGSPEEEVVRLAEGIRMYRLLPGAKLMVSGGKMFEASPRSSASEMAQMAKGLGVDPKDIVLEDASRDTKDEARIIRSIIHGKPFVLVTSAYHMPRSMALFKAQGMHPIPDPTGYRTAPYLYLRPDKFFPSACNILETEIVLHEIFGLISAKVMGQI